MKMPPFPLFLLLFFSSGCIFDSSDTSAPKPQGFTYSISPLGIDTHPGGGGLILVSLDPSKEFTGDLFIRVYPPEHVRVVPQTIRLTHEWRFDEIEVYIDSTAAEGEMEMDITAEHEGATYTTVVPVKLQAQHNSIIGKGALDTHNPPISLCNWLSANHPELGIMMDGNWRSWCENRSIKTTNLSFRYVNLEWDIRMQLFPNNGTYVFYWVRKRGECEPIFYAKSKRKLIQILPDEVIQEITKDEFRKIIVEERP